jgi:UDP-N-acetylglucosamine--N-acetylmuramyl-(pentapeptide) pyrophosphoryl-undecaprenol N-acetylglucosamine transferase
VHEVAVTGHPGVLVPWAASAEDHQTANVRWLADRGAAVLLPEGRHRPLGDVVERCAATTVAAAATWDGGPRLGAVHRSGALAQLVESVALA